jgi:hypothetical protein
MQTEKQTVSVQSYYGDTCITRKALVVNGVAIVSRATANRWARAIGLIKGDALMVFDSEGDSLTIDYR